MVKGVEKMTSLKNSAITSIPTFMVKKILTYTFLTVAAIVTLTPFLWMLSTSLKDMGEVFVYPPEFIPKTVVWSNYIQAWTSSNFYRYFFNTAFVAIAVVIGQVFTSSLSAFSFSRLKYHGRDKIFLIYLATMMIPAQVTMIPNFILIKTFNWLNSFPALIFPMMFTAFGTFLLRQFFLTIPTELDEAAVIDGAGYFRIYSTIILPLSRPALATLSVFSFMGSWNSFLWPLIVVNTDEMRTLTLGLINFRGYYTAQWNLIMTATMISVIPIMLLYLSAQKYFIEGIALTGVKG